jgi:hypothetical protein
VLRSVVPAGPSLRLEAILLGDLKDGGGGKRTRQLVD